MKIFLDSGNPEDTGKFFKNIDGQTTNPSLVAKNPEVRKYVSKGKKLTQKEALNLYREIIQEISRLSPNLFSISIEVIANKRTDYQTMLRQAEEMNTWASNAHLKFPCNLEGTKAADKFLSYGGRVNMTLVFCQTQALALARIAQKNNIQDPEKILISPFLGRLDDQGVRGVSLVEIIQKLRKELNASFRILAASIRDLNHLKSCSDFLEKNDFVTIPTSLLEKYLEITKQLDFGDFQATKNFESLNPIRYQNLELFEETDWQKLDLEHPLLTKGLEKFTQDWESFSKS